MVNRRLSPGRSGQGSGAREPAPAEQGGAADVALSFGQGRSEVAFAFRPVRRAEVGYASRPGRERKWLCSRGAEGWLCVPAVRRAEVGMVPAGRRKWLLVPAGARAELAMVRGGESGSGSCVPAGARAEVGYASPQGRERKCHLRCGGAGLEVGYASRTQGESGSGFWVPVGGGLEVPLEVWLISSSPGNQFRTPVGG